jgi:hypothetical protein
LAHAHGAGSLTGNGAHDHGIRDNGHVHQGLFQERDMGPLFPAVVIGQEGTGGGNLTGGGRGAGLLQIQSSYTNISVNFADPIISVTGATASDGGNESRPRNVAGRWIMYLFN